MVTLPQMNPENDPYNMSTANPTIHTAYSATRDTAVSLLYALYLSFTPHSRNSPTRKRITTMLFLVWGAVTVLRYLGFADAGEHGPEVYWAMTVIVFSIVSHLWGFEYGVLSAVTADVHDDDSESEEGD